MKNCKKKILKYYMKIRFLLSDKDHIQYLSLIRKFKPNNIEISDRLYLETLIRLEK